jgi:hypothetical protein
MKQCGCGLSKIMLSLNKHRPSLSYWQCEVGSHMKGRRCYGQHASNKRRSTVRSVLLRAPEIQLEITSHLPKFSVSYSPSIFVNSPLTNFMLTVKFDLGCLHPVACVRSGDGGFYSSTKRHFRMLILLYYYTATCFCRTTIFRQKIYNSLRITQLTTDPLFQSVVNITTIVIMLTTRRKHVAV